MDTSTRADHSQGIKEDKGAARAVAGRGRAHQRSSCEPARTHRPAHRASLGRSGGNSGRHVPDDGVHGTQGVPRVSPEAEAVGDHGWLRRNRCLALRWQIMSVLLDTSILVAAANPADQNSGRSIEIFEGISEGEYGAPYLTDYVVDEALTLAWVRTKRPKIVLDLADWLLAPGAKRRPGRLVFVGEDAFEVAAALHRRHLARLSFTDCTSLAVVRALHIDRIATFEAGFDGLAGVLR